VTAAQLQIAPEEFITFDLKGSGVPAGNYDIAISLEVGEHLLSTSAVGFLEDLTET
jgi:hypothetical protein